MTAEAAAGARAGFGRRMLTVFAPFACGYYFSYLYRTVNAMVAPDLRQDVGIGAAELGLITAAYFMTFALCQIPLGVVLDRYGPRRVQTCLYAIAGMGALVFAAGDSVAVLALGRALIGIGVSGGLMASLKAIVQWFPRERIALLNGWILATGGLGAMSSTAPVELVLRFTDWHGLFVGLAIGTFAAALLIFLAVPDKPGAGAGGSLAEQLAAVGAIYRDRFFWRIVPVMFTCAASNMAFQGLWAGPWLAEVEGLDRPEVAAHLLAFAAAVTLGAAFSGVVAEGLRRIGVSLTSGVGIGAASFILAQLLILLRASDATYLLWIFLGLSSTLVSLTFAAMAMHFPESRIGRANTAANVLVFCGSFTYQFGLGAIVALWTPEADGSYPEIAYAAAWGAAIATQAIAFVWYVVAGLREKGTF